MLQMVPPRDESPTLFQNVILPKICARCGIAFTTYFRMKKRCAPCQQLAHKEGQKRNLLRFKKRKQLAQIGV